MFGDLTSMLGSLLALPGVLLVSATILSSPEDLSQIEYDFIIVGGGTAGSVLANRLTEDASVNVLMIEAGASNDGNVATMAPFLAVSLPGTVVDWNFTTTAQGGYNGRSIPFTRGHVLGGSSVVNLLTWNRGSDDVWDRWANLTEDSNWSWDSVAQYYEKTNSLVKPADGHDTTGQVIPADYGSGPVDVSVPGFSTELDDPVITTAKQLGGRFIFNEDFNGGNSVGVSYMDSSVGGGQRSSAATAYLNGVTSRSNLDVLINSVVSRLLESTPNTSPPTFNAVELVQDTGESWQVNATKELILSAGVIGTPQILLRSGIGPKTTLNSLEIMTILDIADVGQNLADHPLVPNYFNVSSDRTFDDVLRNTTLFAAELNEWLDSKQGLFVDSPGNTIAFTRLPDGHPALEGIPDPSAGSHSGHTEMIWVDGFAAFGTIAQPATGNFMTILTAVISPTSRGTVSIPSSDPFANPLIDPAYLTTNFDITAMIQAMKDAQTFIAASPWAGLVKGPFGDLANAVTDDELEAYARANAVTINHPVGTARMSPANADWGVVDSNLLVKGALGLRIVDASIFPAIPECHVQSPVYVVAERAADLIKAAHGL